MKISTPKRAAALLVGAFFSLTFIHCVNQDASSQPLEIIGNYVDNFAGTYAITADSWLNFGCKKSIIASSNETRTLVYQEAYNAACYNQGKFGKIYWIAPQAIGNFYHCESVYNKNTFDEANNDASPPSTANPGSTGCGGFSWSYMTKQ